MKIAFPIENNKGLESLIYDHFGRAPEFLIVDTETLSCQPISNNKLSDENSGCKSHVFTDHPEVNAIITECIGDGSLRNLTKAGIKVYKATKGSINKHIDLFNGGSLNLFHMLDICRLHKNKKEGKGCGNH